MEKQINTGFPCNNGTAYAIITNKRELFITNSKKCFDNAMKNGFIEIRGNKIVEV